MTTTLESVAMELDAMAITADGSAATAGHDYAQKDARSRAHAYRDAAALLRARALPAMDREGLVACIRGAFGDDGVYASTDEEDGTLNSMAEAAARAILTSFAPPAPVVTDAMVEAGARGIRDATHAVVIGADGQVVGADPWDDPAEKSVHFHDARACLTAALGTPQPAQASEPAEWSRGDGERLYAAWLEHRSNTDPHGAFARALNAAFPAHATVVERERAGSYELVLRSLASYLSAGGFNSPTCDAAEFEAKIRWGIDNACRDAHGRRARGAGEAAGAEGGRARVALRRRPAQ